MLTFTWCFDQDKAADYAAFFRRNITNEYISHSELQGPRTDESGAWVSDLDAVFEEEILEAISGKPISARKKGFTRNICGVLSNGKLVAMAYVSVERGARKTYATLEDIVVDQSQRGGKIGAQTVSWIIQELETAGVRRVFLESGLHNDHAHHFFESFGFRQCSIVMMRA
jgi:GNAT superfamily N-acetyltransferase